MSAVEPIGPARFRLWIARRLGLHFDDGKLSFLATVLARRAGASGGDAHSYLDRLEGRDPQAELRSLAGDLTVAETYFFRHMEQFRAFSEVALAGAERQAIGSAPVSILSAGCASGEEAYSLAMCVQERGGPAGSARIVAADLNPLMLDKARRGVYSAWSLRDTPPETRRRWFRPVGREFEVDPAIRAAVTFVETNLARDDQEVWSGAVYDVIFCRNVMMYFTPEAGRAMVARLTRALRPGGYLFLGHAETLRGLSAAYHLRQSHATFYYQRMNAEELAVGEGIVSSPDGERAAARFAGDAVAAVMAVPGAGAAWASEWLDTVRASSERIRTLTERGSGPGPAAGIATPGRSAEIPGRRAGAASTAARPVEMRPVLELLRADRFASALHALESLPPESQDDPHALLVRATLLMHSGEIDAAETAAKALLARKEHAAAAHYLLAICRESAGDRRSAVEHGEAAADLDPTFAMPRLHLGLMALRSGEPAAARRELTAAASLLEQEDEDRLALFGGGFGRDALIALCSAGLGAEGGES